MPWKIMNTSAAEIAPDWLQPYCKQFLRKPSDQGYLFKLRLTKNVKSLIERTFARFGWQDAGQGWQWPGGRAEARGLEPLAPRDRVAT